MAASNKTVQALVKILIEEIGYVRAKKLVFRVQREVQGNQSFRESMLAIANEFTL